MLTDTWGFYSSDHETLCHLESHAQSGRNVLIFWRNISKFLHLITSQKVVFFRNANNLYTPVSVNVEITRPTLWLRIKVYALGCVLTIILNIFLSLDHHSQHNPVSWPLYTTHSGLLVIILNTFLSLDHHSQHISVSWPSFSTHSSLLINILNTVLSLDHYSQHICVSWPSFSIQSCFLTIILNTFLSLDHHSQHIPVSWMSFSTQSCLLTIIFNTALFLDRHSEHNSVFSPLTTFAPFFRIQLLHFICCYRRSARLYTPEELVKKCTLKFFSHVLMSAPSVHILDRIWILS